ncbi:MAG: hypothetical protein ACI90V_006654 [Bacillariaceae sp.]|jgi:hypothetical protein
MNSNSFSSIPPIAYIDPIRCPATAALEKLNNKYYDDENENENENEMDQTMDQQRRKPPQRRVRLLSEGDGDYDPYHSFIVSGIHTGKEQIDHATFDYISSSQSDLSDVEEESSLSFLDNNDDDDDDDGGEVLNTLISHNKNANNNNNLKKFLLVMDEMKKSRDRGGVMIVKKQQQQRRLVRCIALESRLAYLDHPSDGIIWHNY